MVISGIIAQRNCKKIVKYRGLFKEKSLTSGLPCARMNKRHGSKVFFLCAKFQEREILTKKIRIKRITGGGSCAR